MTRYTLNIGMDYKAADDIKQRWTKAEVEAAVRDWLGHDEFDAAYYVSDSEPTAVVAFGREMGFRSSITQLCNSLKQEAIAFTIEGVSRRGHIAGPSAHVWGEFDPTRFIQLDGTSVSGGRTFPLYVEPGAAFMPKPLTTKRASAVVETLDAIDAVRGQLSAAGQLYFRTNSGTYNQLRTEPEVEHFFLLKDGSTHISAKLVRPEGEDPWVNICYVPTGATVMLRRADFKRLVKALEVLP